MLTCMLCHVFGQEEFAVIFSYCLLWHLVGGVDIGVLLLLLLLLLVKLLLEFGVHFWRIIFSVQMRKNLLPNKNDPEKISHHHQFIISSSSNPNAESYFPHRPTSSNPHLLHTQHHPTPHSNTIRPIIR